PATVPPQPQPQTADSVLGTAEAARQLGISGQAVRAAAKRGTLAGQHDRITGAWVFAASAVARYGREHAKGQGGHSRQRGTAGRALAGAGGVLAPAGRSR